MICSTIILNESQDLETPESKGNDKADKLANDFRLLSANDAPQKYLTSTEEIFILSQKGYTKRSSYLHEESRVRIVK